MTEHKSKYHQCCGAIKGTPHKLSCIFNPHRMPPRVRPATFDPPDMTDEPVYLGVDPAKPGSDESITFVAEGHLVNPVLTIQPQPINITFYDDVAGRQVGEFLWDKEKQTWTFKGDMDAAAKQFAKFMFAHFQSILDGDRDKLLDDAITDMYGGKVDEHEPEPETVWPEKTPMPGSLSHKTFKQIYEGKF